MPLMMGRTASLKAAVSVSNKHKFQRAFGARGLNSLRALSNVYRPKGNNLNLTAYKINA